MVAAVSLGTRSSMTGRWTSEVLDNIKQLLQVFICLFVFSTGAAPLSKLWCAFLPRKRRRGEAVLLSDNTSVKAIKNRSVPRQTSRFSVTDRDEALLVLLLSPCFTSRLRLRLGALSKKKVSFFLDIRWPNTQMALVFQIKASESVFPLVCAQAHLEANFEVIFWQPASAVGLSAVDMAPCVWGTALCVRVNPQAEVQPIAFSHH